MAIPKHEIAEMNRLLESGLNVADIWVKYQKYDYWEVYWSVKDYSLLGKKRMITNRLNAAKNEKSPHERDRLISEAQGLIKEIYDLAKKNGQKLVDIGRVIQK